MRTIPHQWTHHHVRRLYHLSMISAWVAMICVLIAGQFLLWADADAFDVTDSHSTTVTASVGLIDTTPVTPAPEGGGGTIPIPATTQLSENA